MSIEILASPELLPGTTPWALNQQPFPAYRARGPGGHSAFLAVAPDYTPGKGDRVIITKEKKTLLLVNTTTEHDDDERILLVTLQGEGVYVRPFADLSTDVLYQKVTRHGGYSTAHFVLRLNMDFEFAAAQLEAPNRPTQYQVIRAEGPNGNRLVLRTTCESGWQNLCRSDIDD